MLQIVHASLQTHMTYTAATFWVGYHCWRELAKLYVDLCLITARISL